MKRLLLALALTILLCGPAFSATDNFNRTDGAIGSNWTTITSEQGCNVNTNAFAPSNATNLCGVYWNVDTPNADQSSQATFLPAFGAVYAIAVLVRVSTSAETYYAGGFDTFNGGSSTYRIWKRTAGTWAGICVGTHDNAANDVIRLEVSGTTLTLYVNNVQECQGTDSAIATGRWGLAAVRDTTAPSMDDWTGANLGGATPVKHRQGGLW